MNQQQTVIRIATLLLLLSTALSAQAQTSAFTYQGRLSDGGTAANGNYDLQFALFDSLGGGTQVGSTQSLSNVSVSAGIFTVSLDFGAAAFPGANRWLELSARVTGTPTFTTLSPRQPISSTPYAIRALTSATAENVSADGTVTGNIVNAASQFNLNGQRILTGLTTNLFTGLSAGQSNTTGMNNAFFGFGAGQSNTEGTSNSFFGASAGAATTTGVLNAFFGYRAGLANTNIAGNPFAGSFNSFFGAQAGEKNTTGAFNSFFGYIAGQNTTVGGGNSFFGRWAGQNNISGNDNVFLGDGAGLSNINGSDNMAIGAFSNFASDGLTNAMAIGTRARVDQSNSMVLGSIAGVNGASSSVSVGIGTTTPAATLDVAGSGVFRPGGLGEVREVSLASPSGETGVTIKGTINRADLRFDGSTLKLVAGAGTGPPASSNGLAVDISGNVGIGTATPQATLDVNGAAVFRPAGIASPRATSFASPNGETGMTINGSTNRADVRFDSTALRLVAGPGTGPPSATNGISITTSGNVGVGQSSPLAKLDVAGTLKVDSLAGGGDQSICRNSTFNTIATCSSSLRYKNQIVPYRTGLELINRLRPIAFSWKANGSRDLGLGAEDVARVEPLLVTRNDNGEIEGVRYDRLNVVLINAIKQQQEQIDILRAANAALSVRLKSVENQIRKHARGRRK